jgi:hypothetical protein
MLELLSQLIGDLLELLAKLLVFLAELLEDLLPIGFLLSFAFVGVDGAGVVGRRVETTIIDGVVSFGRVVVWSGGGLQTLVEGLQVGLSGLFIDGAVGVACPTTEGLTLLLGFVCFVSHYNYYGCSC